MKSICNEDRRCKRLSSTSCDHSIPFGIRWIHVIRYAQFRTFGFAAQNSPPILYDFCPRSFLGRRIRSSNLWRIQFWNVRELVQRNGTIVTHESSESKLDEFKLVFRRVEERHVRSLSANERTKICWRFLEANRTKTLRIGMMRIKSTNQIGQTKIRRQRPTRII